MKNKFLKKNYPTKREFEEKCIDILSSQNFTDNWSSSYFVKLLKWIAPDFTMRQSQPLEQERYQVDKNSIVNFFQKLQNLRFEEISPKLVINIDERGLEVQNRAEWNLKEY